MRISRLLRGANFPAANYSLAETRNALKSRLLICVKCPRCLPALLLVPSFSLCILLSLSPSAYFSPCDSRTRPSCALHHAYSCTLKLNSLAPVRSHNIPTFPYAVLDTHTVTRTPHIRFSRLVRTNLFSIPIGIAIDSSSCRLPLSTYTLTIRSNCIP